MHRSVDAAAHASRRVHSGRMHSARMHTVHADVHRRGGVAATFELLRDGHTSHQLTRAVRRGEVQRIRQGHYGCPELTAPEAESIRVGGRLTGLAAATHYGLWAPRHPRVEVLVPPHARALRTRDDATRRRSDHPDPSLHVSWADHGASGTRSVVAPAECVRHIVRFESPIVAFAVAESALAAGRLSRREWSQLLTSLTRAQQRLLASASRLSESGGESMLKFHLRRARIPFRQQVPIDPIGRVDFLLGNRLVIEVDGAAFHSAPDDFERDRRRDAHLSCAGYRTLRFSYQQIDRQPELVLAAIEAALARRDHV